MRRRMLVVVGIAGTLGLSALAQVPQPPQPSAQPPPVQPAPGQGPTLHIGVTAVEIDTVVTDRDGRHARTCRPATSSCCRTASRRRSPESNRSFVVIHTLDARGVQRLWAAAASPFVDNALGVRRQVGFGGSVDMTAPKPGAYQLRVAAGDATSGRTGTGYRFVRVSNLSAKRPALSGVALQGTDAAGSPALRQFHAASTLQYAFDAYNARIDPASHRPSLTVRLRLYRDGALLLDGEPAAVEALPNDDEPGRSAHVSGEMRLSPAMPAGECQMQLEVTDSLKPSRSKDAIARQWVDFTIAAAAP